MHSAETPFFLSNIADHPKILLYVLLLTLFMLMISALLSAAESALTSTSYPRMHNLAHLGNNRADKVLWLRANKEHMINALLLCNSLSNVTASALASAVLFTVFGDAGIAYATLIITIIFFIFAESLPKNYALAHADGFSLLCAPSVYRLVKILMPISRLIAFITRYLFQTTDLSDRHKEEELRGAISLQTQKTKEDLEKKRMLRSILDLNSAIVEDSMTHRSNVLMLNDEESLPTKIQKIIDFSFSRIPVYHKRPDNIIGILHTKSLLSHILDHSLLPKISEQTIKESCTPPLYALNSTSLFAQLECFRMKQEHFSVVVDEYGSFKGIITLEDIIEEIVGDIFDENDVKTASIFRTKDGQYRVRGQTSIRDINREMGWSLPDDDFSTVAGLVICESQSIPEENQEIEFNGFLFRVLKKKGNRLSWIQITPLETETTDTTD